MIKKKIRIFHGSEKVIESPSLALGKKTNDYGQGFYCTEDKELAKEWASRHQNNGFCNEYEFSLEGLKILNLNDGSFTVLHWLALLLKNRDFGVSNDTAKNVRDFILGNYLPNLRGVDVIIGYRADDSYFDFAKAFLNNSFPLSELEWALKNGNLGEQVALVSKKAFKNLRFKSAESVSAKTYYPRMAAKERKAKKDYFSLSERPFDKNEIYAIDIIRNEMTEYVPLISKK